MSEQDQTIETIEVDLDTDEQPFTSNVDEGAYVHTFIAGFKALVPTRAFTLPPEARQNFERGTAQPLSTLPKETRQEVLNALKGPEATWKARNGKWTY